MTDSKNAQVNRLYESMPRHIGEEQALMFANAHTLPKSPSVERRAAWACEVCRDLEAGYDEDMVRKVRASCHCKPSESAVKRLRGCYIKAGICRRKQRTRRTLDGGRVPFYALSRLLLFDDQTRRRTTRQNVVFLYA